MSVAVVVQQCYCQAQVVTGVTGGKRRVIYAGFYYAVTKGDPGREPVMSSQSDVRFQPKREQWKKEKVIK